MFVHGCKSFHDSRLVPRLPDRQLSIGGSGRSLRARNTRGTSVLVDFERGKMRGVICEKVSDVDK